MAVNVGCLVGAHGDMWVLTAMGVTGWWCGGLALRSLGMLGTSVEDVGSLMVVCFEPWAL